MADFVCPACLLGTVAAAIAFSCYRAWRADHTPPFGGKCRIRLDRIIREGERLLAIEDSLTGHRDPAYVVLECTADTARWHRESLEVLQKHYPAYWDYFDDIGVYKGDREAVVQLIQRIRDLIALKQ